VGTKSSQPITEPQLIELGSKVTKLYAGREHVFARTEDGDFYAWGNNSSGQCGLEPELQVGPTRIENSNFSDFIPGAGHNLAIDSEDMVWGWGDNNLNQLGFQGEEKVDKPQQILTEPVEIAAAGLNHNFVLTKKGEVVGWGTAKFGKLRNVVNHGDMHWEIEIPTKSPVVFLFCGVHCSAVGTLDGSLFVLGPRLDTGNVNVYPLLIKNFKIHLPEWGMIMEWLFLGCLDENSIFYCFPKEILLNFVHVISVNKISGQK
jgi:hypothetical protein